MQVAFPWPTLAPACSARWVSSLRCSSARCRAKPMGPDSLFAGADLHAGFPGRPLADGKEVGQTGRQQSRPASPPASQDLDATSTSPPRGAIWERSAQAIGAPDSYPPDYGNRAVTLEESRRAQRRDRRLDREEKHRHLGEGTKRVRGVPCGPIYSIDQMFEDAQVSISHRQTFQRRATAHTPGRPAGHAVAHAERDGGAAAGVRRADRRGAG